jgi:hypothetical protein
MNFNIESLVKDAVLFGLAIGILAAALYIILAYGNYLARPKVTVAAAVKPPFGFQLPE